MKFTLPPSGRGARAMARAEYHPTTWRRLVRPDEMTNHAFTLALPIITALNVAGCSVITSIDDECAADSDCTGFATCSAGLCVPLPSSGSCNVQTDCDLGEACSDGECFTLAEERINDDITTNTTWRNDRLYVLEDTIFVREPAVLTIEAGTQVVAGVQRAALVVDNGRLDVRGTADAPVVFTSANPPGQRAAGDWGGVALVGDAPVNTPSEFGRPRLEGIEPDLFYGGDDADHNCGTLQYFRIEFAGFVLAQDVELNGLTLAGCGRTTLVEHVQVHRGRDDGIEIFGGAPNLRYAVISDSGDDGLDWDGGWQGNGQFILIRQADSGTSGIEADNSAGDIVDPPVADAGDWTPRSAPTIYNLTVVGTRDPRFAGGATNDASIGASLRRGTAPQIANAIFTNQGAFPVLIDGRDSQQCALLGTDPEGGEDCDANPGVPTTLQMRATVFHQTTNRAPADLFPAEEDGQADGFVHETWTSSSSIQLDLGRGDLLVDPFRNDPQFDRPRFYALDGTISSLPIEAESPPTGVEFFDRNDPFIGAIRSADDDWTEGWTNYPAD